MLSTFDPDCAGGTAEIDLSASWRVLEGLMQAARGAMEAAVELAKRQEVKPGYIVVLQTARRVANYNPHLHVLMTEGGLTGAGECQTMGYVPYDNLHRQWQAHILSGARVKPAASET